jgi:hypothetical protein
MKYASDHLMLAEDPLSFNVIYMPKYLQIFIYLISQDMRTMSKLTMMTPSRGEKLRLHRHVHSRKKNSKSFFFLHVHVNVIMCSNSTAPHCALRSIPPRPPSPLSVSLHHHHQAVAATSSSLIQHCK